MGQFSKILLTIDNAHTVPQCPRLWTRFRWVKPDLYAQPSHSLCLEYLWQVYQHLYQMYK